ncbi:cobalamin-binding protein [Halorussus halophilus]|uniref:cobalamin-binding protein n=1 Tax=Halorussus halophilus TaxID=2650975 RepID=UPI001300F077|nr:cobalamin-binding protein [Halorussus halophilus]
MADLPRIVSLAPSATETVRALDATDRLVGVTNHCEDFERGRSAERAPTRVGGWLNPDYDAVAELNPDLVLTADDLQTEVTNKLRGRGYRVVQFSPTTLGEVVESFAEIGRTVGDPKAGHDLAWRARSRLHRVRSLVAPYDRPVVYCEEWPDPPMAAGNWVPQAVEVAGGSHPFVEPGERSHEVSTEEIESAAPEHVVCHYCGRGDSADPESVVERNLDVPAVERGNVHVLHDSLLNQPSPRLLDGVERLAVSLHPEIARQ